MRVAILGNDPLALRALAGARPAQHEHDLLALQERRVQNAGVNDQLGLGGDDNFLRCRLDSLQRLLGAHVRDLDINDNVLVVIQHRPRQLFEHGHLAKNLFDARLELSLLRVCRQPCLRPHPHQWRSATYAHGSRLRRLSAHWAARRPALHASESANTVLG